MRDTRRASFSPTKAFCGCASTVSFLYEISDRSQVSRIRPCKDETAGDTLLLKLGARKYVYRKRGCSMSEKQPAVNQPSAPEPQTLITGLPFGESPPWHGDRLWVSDWGAREIIAVDSEGKSEVMARLPFPSFQAICFDWLPDGRLLVVSSRDRLLLRKELDGSLVTHADLSSISERGHPWNEIVVDGRGNVYINNQGFYFPGGNFDPGTISFLT